ncbi:phosphatidylglycerophosphatase A [Xinfangfangia sp. CPCC 101601]|uniref:Phosphatidylglycerophosphatase A n=1 Tax=Pseudogemmobacter lacusdianii TaxID=3069608 RepID=A0ABU0VX15_9RHOB|nr:phosphatidylglycerophosphatase A [Xinfangfangia sp. CPCC 101601]MDQ2065445.1 phosphatidylglycerophosphatase A [Xinfangfangia sp. CPCC 101601]
MNRAIATFFYIGHLRPAPGTWGSLAAAVLGVLAYQCGAGWLVPLGAVLATILGFWAVPLYLQSSASSDPSEVVIDEVAGLWLAMSFPVIPLMMRGVEMGFFSGAWPGWVAPFLLFRLFDIWKPWLVGRADRRGDAAGVMLDDLWAGLFAGIGSILLAALYHVVLFA